jgi:imidazolonepropionase-like amidohydrolase
MVSSSPPTDMNLELSIAAGQAPRQRVIQEAMVAPTRELLRRRPRVWFSLWLAAMGCGAPSHAPGAPGADAGAPTLVITHVTVIDPRDGTAASDRTVAIRGDRIVDVTSSAGAVPPGARTVDATGKFVIPGLWDMHIHTYFGTWVPGGDEVTLPLFIASGVTGVRDMGSDLEPILAARAAIAQGRKLGPRLVIAGPMLDGPKTQFPASIAIATPDDGRRAVEMLAGRGVDFIKLQSYVPREAYFAIADESKKRGLPFVGHVPDAIRGAEAASAGQKSFEHLIGIFEGSSTAEDALLAGGKSPAKFLATYDAGKEAALIQLLAARQVWQCPTLYWERGQWLVDAIDISRDPDAQYAPVSWREQSWPRFTQSIIKELDTDPLPVRQRFVAHELEIVRRLHAAGVPLLAGTDTPAGVDVIPGVSLHRELARFVDAGLSPLQALQTATINPARFLGREAELGTVERGKLADLVLLDQDPRVDIANTRAIAAVVAAGLYRSHADLDAILRDVAAAARTR